MVFLQTGQIHCYDEMGRQIPCHGSGQDGEVRSGAPWPKPRFITKEGLVLDQATGLTWPQDGGLSDYSLTWMEALEFVAELNRRHFLGYSDWRLPNRRELRSLMSYQTKKPPLPQGHPFKNIFQGWYWTSTSAAINPAYAWYIHLGGARMFYGHKEQDCLVWPVRGQTRALLQTGQIDCFDPQGRQIPCHGSGQDGEVRSGAPWPKPRFITKEGLVLDQATGLTWLRMADISGQPVTWSQALELITRINAQRLEGRTDWRLPNINELETLVDCSRHHPALPGGHPFVGIRDVYWSSTTSFFETDWAWALYLHKGALGVGLKRRKNFFVWPVSGGL